VNFQQPGPKSSDRISPAGLFTVRQVAKYAKCRPGCVKWGVSYYRLPSTLLRLIETVVEFAMHAQLI
jgi:hypothetical protein